MTRFFSFHDVFYVQDNKLILRSISASFQRGEIVCLLGNNGSGKSSLFKIGAGIFQASDGQVCYENKNLELIPSEERARLMGWLPQIMPRPFQMQLYDFFQLTPFETTESSEKNTKLDYAKLFEVEKFLQQDISTLSGGEWKRAQLARLWQQQSPILFLDEPDADLDMKHKQRLISFCHEYKETNHALLFISTHNLHFAKSIATRICALSEGGMVWDSSAEEFWNLPVSQKLYGCNYSMG